MDFHNRFGNTILQANSIGLVVEKALPCHCEDIAEFEDPSQIPCAENFVLNNAQMSANATTGNAKLKGSITGAGGVIAKIDLKDIDGNLVAATLTDADGNWQIVQIEAGQYELFQDSTNHFVSPVYEILAGTKQQLLTLEEAQTMNIVLEVHKL
jgi:hypothetical protein